MATLLAVDVIWQKKRSTLSAASSVLASTEGCQLVDLIFAGLMLGDEIRGIGITADVPRGNCPLPDFLLYPQGMRFEMAKLAQSRPGRNPDRCAGARPDAD